MSDTDDDKETVALTELNQQVVVENPDGTRRKVEMTLMKAPENRGHAAIATEPDIAGAAAELASRITAAVAAGYRVQMPFTVAQLGMITVSAGAKALGEAQTHVPVAI